MGQNQKTFAIIGGVAAIVGYHTVNYLAVRKTERKRCEQIELNLQRDLAMIKRAGQKMEESFANGTRYRGIVDVMDAFEFHRMTSYLED